MVRKTDFMSDIKIQLFEFKIFVEFEKLFSFAKNRRTERETFFEDFYFLTSC